jgi:hypothetical protein
LVKCEVGARKDNEDLEKLGNYLQGEEGGDEEVAYWPGIADSGAAEDRKRLRLTMKMVPECFWMPEMMAKMRMMIRSGWKKGHNA